MFKIPGSRGQAGDVGRGKTNYQQVQENLQCGIMSLMKVLNSISYEDVSIMLKENMITAEDVVLSNIDYAFFTNEDGHSDAGYLINDQKTRNVNIYSSDQPLGKGFDPADSILANMQKCFEELGGDKQIKHKFFMTSYYANMGKSEPRIISCDNLVDLKALESQAKENLFVDDENQSNPNRLGLDSKMREALNASDVSVIRADALIFKGIPGEDIAVLGASGDAHPIMMFDDENRIASYISGAHMTLKQGVLEQTFDRMIALGANPANIRLVIGPGLGAKSYEFGDNAPDYFSIQEQAERVLKPAIDRAGSHKYLVDIKELVTVRLTDRLAPEHIYNTEIDTMGFDLYDEVVDESGAPVLQRKTTVNFAELNRNGPLFFGARRGIMEQKDDLMEHNSAAYNTIGRHAAGFSL